MGAEEKRGIRKWSWLCIGLLVGLGFVAMLCGLSNCQVGIVYIILCLLHFWQFFHQINTSIKPAIISSLLAHTINLITRLQVHFIPISQSTCASQSSLRSSLLSS